ncbi:MAG: class I SAM-dependent methyltransferase [Acidobacteria bacterium]|nr:class I SAM-dependent methyltransferase [Acidobacteriota bacterium]
MAEWKFTLPGHVKSSLSSMYHRIFPFWVRLRCIASDFGDRSPSLPPALLRFRVSESFSVGQFNAIGEGCAMQLADIACAFGVDILNAGVALDFGCGCGRTIRQLLAKTHSTTFIGTDVDHEAVAWCSSNLAGASFFTNEMVPPLMFDFASFDLVYCISVFTHLDERLQDLWLEELFRVIRPGGILILSVHGRNAHRSLPEFQIQKLKSYGILHLTSKKLLGIVPEQYHTTWHTEEYIVSRLSAQSKVVCYRTIPDGIQDYVVAIKK